MIGVVPYRGTRLITTGDLSRTTTEARKRTWISICQYRATMHVPSRAVVEIDVKISIRDAVVCRALGLDLLFTSYFLDLIVHCSIYEVENVLLFLG